MLNFKGLVLLGGLPGIGKSTYAKQFIDNGFKYVNPDSIRFELAKKIKGNEYKYESELEDILQQFSFLAWKISHNQAVEHLKNNHSVIFDATFLSVRDRVKTIEFAKNIGQKTAICFLEAPVEVALERNKKRGNTIIAYRDNRPIYGRFVPEIFIKEKYKQIILPSYNEGFDAVKIEHIVENKNINYQDCFKTLKESSDLMQTMQEYYDNGVLKELFPSFHEVWGFNQDNKNHQYLLHEHMIKAAQHVQNESMELFIATLLHDVGKPMTKQYFGKLTKDTSFFKKGEKVEILKDNKKILVGSKHKLKNQHTEVVDESAIEIDKNAHYYGHQFTSAFIARRDLDVLNVDEQFKDKVYFYILYHMDLPFSDINIDHIAKMETKVGYDNTIDLLKLRVADKSNCGGAFDVSKEIELFLSDK